MCSHCARCALCLHRITHVKAILSHGANFSHPVTSKVYKFVSMYHYFIIYLCKALFTQQNFVWISAWNSQICVHSSWNPRPIISYWESVPLEKNKWPVTYWCSINLDSTSETMSGRQDTNKPHWMNCSKILLKNPRVLPRISAVNPQRIFPSVNKV